MGAINYAELFKKVPKTIFAIIAAQSIAVALFVVG